MNELMKLKLLSFLSQCKRTPTKSTARLANFHNIAW